MFPSKLIAAIVATGLFCVPLPSADAFDPAPNIEEQVAHSQLIQQFQNYAKFSDGVVGITATDLSTGETIDLNGDTVFPMASIYKVAVAGKVLSLIDAGHLSLEKMVVVDPSLLSEGGIADLYPRGGVSLTIYNLLDLMLTKSDNSATDLLIAQAGGVRAVNDWVHSTGVNGVRVDHNTAQLLYRAMGLRAETKGNFRQNSLTAKSTNRTLAERDARDLPNIEFANDVVDTATPNGMVQLLNALSEGKVLKPQTTAVLMEIMGRCETGAKRLKGMLPPGTPIAHKTGSLNGLGNDAGIITMPDGRKIAIAVFVMKDSRGRIIRDQIMAESARAAYDYFLHPVKREKI